MQKISELIVLKIENINLKLQMLQSEAKSLIEEARVEINAPADYIYNIGGFFQAPVPSPEKEKE